MPTSKNRYYLVDAGALPEVFVKVTQAKELLETGSARTVAEAVERVDLSRSAFYKYKDAIRPFRDMKRDSIVTFTAILYDNPGVLASLLTIFTASGANILTINQSIPTDGAALVTISVTTENMTAGTDELMGALKSAQGVITVDIVAG